MSCFNTEVNSLQLHLCSKALPQREIFAKLHRKSQSHFSACLAMETLDPTILVIDLQQEFGNHRQRRKLCHEASITSTRAGVECWCSCHILGFDLANFPQWPPSGHPAPIPSDQASLSPSVAKGFSSNSFSRSRGKGSN